MNARRLLPFLPLLLPLSGNTGCEAPVHASTLDDAGVDLGGGADAGPGNLCAPVAALRCGESVSGDTSDVNAGATDVFDHYPVAVGDYSGPEIAYRFDAAASGEVTLRLRDPAPTELNHDLFVLQESAAGCSNADAVARGFNDVTFEAEAGARYYLVVDGFHGEAGPFDAQLECDGEAVEDERGLLARLETTPEAEGWAPDFPAPADLAVVLGADGDPLIPASTPTAAGPLLPPSWVQSVSEAFYDTDVFDAVEVENVYEDWRLVSLRITPCGPLGLTPDQDIDRLCWPAVRLVWQPVVQDLPLAWGAVAPTYADDRAIHAIYPLVPRDRDGAVLSTHARDEVTEHLALGRSHHAIPAPIRHAFEQQRDTTALWLLEQTHALRNPDLPVGAWEAFGPRPELSGAQATAAFVDALRGLLAQTATPETLAELTAFSLPEGRAPATSDLWVFVGFHGNRGTPLPKDLTVIGRDSGRELVNIGRSEAVGVGVEDPAVDAALAAGDPELEDSLILGVDEITTTGEAIADPYEFGVPNTNCASCHRLNDGLRFNFHALSGFETDAIFVSPRVVGDVERELGWVAAGER
jgi:hypothetical protein